MPTSPNVAAVIPARFASSRFPGKPLALIAGKTMIERVYNQARQAHSVARVLVATDDERIFNVVKAFGGECIMTGSQHATGTDRLAEVAGKIPELDIIVNVQGDEPLMDPAAIDAVVQPLLWGKAEMSTIAARIKDKQEAETPHVVKVVFGKDGTALYFSRLPIPFYRTQGDAEFQPEVQVHFGHVGIYAYTRHCLARLSTLEPTPLEKAEALEQLRALENGIKINVVEFNTRSLAVDVPEDIAKVENALRAGANSAYNLQGLDGLVVPTQAAIR